MKSVTHIIFVSLVLLLSMGSCSQSSDHDQMEISLNEGTKWKVHDNMMIHLDQMSNDISSLATSATRDYDGLSKSLLSGIDALVDDCTMKGPAHDELHKWLHPFITTVNDYQSDLPIEEKDEWFTVLQDSMKEFEQYFE